MSLGERIITALTGEECGDESNHETLKPGLRLAGVVRL